MNAISTTLTEVANAALDKLGEKHITDIDSTADSVALRVKPITLRVIAQVQTRRVFQKLMLKETLVAALPDDDGNTRWTLPDDCLVPRALSSGAPYELQAGYLYTTDTAPVLSYQAYSIDPDDWDIFVERVVIHSLAAELAQVITQNIALATQQKQEAEAAANDATAAGMLAGASGYARPGGFNWLMARRVGSRGEYYSGRFIVR